jgi:energy-coupling factor transporter ATP-binding protein EcfA2
VTMLIQVKNVQSLSDVRIEAEGFTAITGKSNLGKSALLRATTGALFGWPGDHYVREGQPTCAVGLKHDNFTLKWRKTKSGQEKPGNTTALEINGQTYSRIGRDQAKLTEPHGIRELDAGTERFRPQVAASLEPPFLLFQNATVVAEVFKLLGRADVFTEAQKLAKKDRTEKEGTLKVRRLDLVAAQQRLDDLKHVEKRRRDLAKTRHSVGNKAQKANVLNQLLDLLTLFKTLKPLDLPAPPQQALLPTQVALKNLLEELKRLTPKPLPQPPTPDLDPTKPHLLVLLEQFRTSTNELKQLHGQQHAIVETIRQLDHRRRELEETLGTCPTCKKSFDQHERARPPGDPEHTDLLDHDVAEVVGMASA